MASIYKRTADRKRRDRPWMIAYTDEDGRRRTVTGSPDKAVTREIARELEGKVSRRKHGVTTADDDRFAEHAERRVDEHLEEYLTHCKHVSLARRTLGMKRKHLEDMIAAINASRLAHLEPNRVERYLQGLRSRDLSARTVNHHRADIVAFMNWCFRTGRVPQNRLSIVPRLNEKEDRRRVRRALSGEELLYLISTAAGYDRANGGRFSPRNIVYLTAALTGLRRGELAKITWCDVDLSERTLRIRVNVGKAKRDDTISLHDQVVRALAQLKPEDAEPNDRVFLTMPTIRTFYHDLARARQNWIAQTDDEHEQQSREQSDFLRQTDSEGRVVDLHAMRTTLGTNLALEGVAPQLAQRIMRHADYRTTLAHYTVLGLADTARAVNTLPGVVCATAATANTAATGTDGSAAPGAARTLQNGAQHRANLLNQQPVQQHSPTVGDQLQLRLDASVSNEPRSVARPCKVKRANGLEPSTFSLEGCKPSNVSSRKHNELQNCPSGQTAPALNPERNSAHIDSDLSAVVKAWPALPNALKTGIMAMVTTASGDRQEA